jgi:hypothetical protein
MHRSNKKDSAKRHRADERQHWLGDTVSAPDSLLFDLTAEFYAADSAILRTASAVAHAYDGDEKRPLAVILAPAESAPWHVGALSKKFDTAICAPERDAILESIERRFNTSLFIGDEPPQQLDNQADFILFSQTSWSSVDELLQAAVLAHRLISENGKACLILPCSGGRIVWQNAESGAIALDREPFTYFARTEEHLFSLAEIAQRSEYGVGDFAKRHRDFFGRYAHDLCLARIYEEDFQKALRAPGEPAAKLLVLEGFVEFAAKLNA